MKRFFRALYAILNYYGNRQRDPQCTRKLAEWVEEQRPIESCSLRNCHKEANTKFNKQCACGKLKATV